MRNRRNKIQFDEMCIQVTKCTPLRYSTRDFWADSSSHRVLGPLFVLGLSIMISRTSDRNLTETSTLIAAILNLMIPFAVYGIGILGMTQIAKLLWSLNKKRGVEDPTPTIRTLLLFIVLAYPFAMFLQVTKSQLFGLEINHGNAVWTAFLLVLSWEVFAAYLVLSVFSPAKRKFEPFAGFASPEAVQHHAQPFVGNEAQPSRLRLSVTGCEPLPLSPREAWYCFWRPEFSLPMAVICICVSMGLVIAFAMNGKPWLDLAITQLILCTAFLILCVLSYIFIAWVMTRSEGRRLQRRKPVNIYSISFLLPISYTAAFALELVQVLLYGQAAIDFSRMIVIGTIFTLIAEACAAYYVSVAVPLIRSKLKAKSQGEPRPYDADPVPRDAKAARSMPVANVTPAAIKHSETSADWSASRGELPKHPSDDHTTSSPLSGRMEKREATPQGMADQHDVDSQMPNPDEPIRFLKIRDRAIPAKDLVMLNAEGNYIRVSEREQSWLTNGPLFEILDTLDYEGGIQIHRSTWVALDACKGVKRRDRKLYVVLHDDTQVRVARGREKDVTEAIAAHVKTKT